MEIKKIYPQGFCEGVIRAINLVKELRFKYQDRPIYVYGMIVHNSYVVNELESLNIITLQRNDECFNEVVNTLPANSILVFSAHGTDEKILNIAKAKDITVYDAICHNVLETRNDIKRMINDGYEILYIGKNHHPEAMAMISINPRHIHLIQDINEIDTLEKNLDKVFVTNQTTLSIYETNEIISKIKRIYPNAIVSDGICNATTLRQKAVIDSNEKDTLIIVGDKLSNNTRQLYENAKKKNVNKVIIVEDETQLRIEQIKGSHSISITSGASTPSYLVDRIIKKIESMN